MVQGVIPAMTVVSLTRSAPNSGLNPDCAPHAQPCGRSGDGRTSCMGLDFLTLHL
jgi:hypothetical protein